MIFQRENLGDEQLLHLHRELLFPRMVEEKMLILLRQGKISKWFSGIGQEAIAVGATLAMDPQEWILPLHRNLGVFTARGLPLTRLIRQWQGKLGGYSKGRERSFHFGSRENHICGMISHLGPQLSVADGIALGNRLSGERLSTLVFTGEAGTSEGEFHEALNLASVWDLPVIFLIENNGYGLSTPVREQYRCNSLAEKAAGYGMEGYTIDGNNILEVYQTVSRLRRYTLEQNRPVLLECLTFRMRGHEEASGTKYVPRELLEQWEARDPIKNYERFLMEEQLLSPEKLEEIRAGIQLHMEQAVREGFEASSPSGDPAVELGDVYAAAPIPAPEPEPGMDDPEMRFIDAISAGLQQAMEHEDRLVLMGQDIAEYGGAFKITRGLVEKFGKDRVRNTPLCESAVIGAALGLSVKGYKAMVEMQFADFVSCGFNQVVNNLAKIHYRWGQPADVVIRMPCGGGVMAGPFHSQSNEAWFAHTPGLKVVYPSTPRDAKGLLIAAIEDPGPVLYFEHKALYRSISGPVPAGYHPVEIGKAHLVRAGTDLSIITYGAGVSWALEAASRLRGTSFHILDLRTLLPLDLQAIREAVSATGKVLVLHEDTLSFGIGAEISAWISEHCFRLLDGPVIRCASLDTPVPFAGPLEESFLARARLDEAIRLLLGF
ncbi:MAG TPA: dehydrogenase E1 component subunit alpha/beta [Chitinophagaceae bacterium]|nr:dehydrogenase E1 component subunit alpha/beta [Chitinophagaceae bacterium]